MKRMKRFLSMLGLGIMCIALSACSVKGGKQNGIAISTSIGGEPISAGPDLSGEDFSGYKIGVSIADGTGGTYQAAYLQALNSYISELGVEAKVFDAFGDPGQQAAQIKTLTTMNMDLLIIWPSNSTAAVNWVQSVNEAGIPVVIANTCVDNDGEQFIAGFVGPSGVDEAFQTGEKMVEDLESCGNIVVINGQDDYAPVKERRKGLTDAIQGTKIQVIEEYNDEGQRSVAKTYMEQCLKKHSIGEIDAIFCYDDEAALGAFDAMKAMKRTGEMRVYVAATGNYDAISYIEDGSICATAIQSPIVDAKTTLGYALWYLLGNPLPDFYNYIETPVITCDNIDNLELTPWES